MTVYEEIADLAYHPDYPATDEAVEAACRFVADSGILPSEVDADAHNGVALYYGDLWICVDYQGDIVAATPDGAIRVDAESFREMLS